MSLALMFAVAGTSSSAASAALAQIERLARERRPDVLTCWAYTSRGVRAKLRAGGCPVDDPAAAFAGLRSAGVKRVAVLSLHMVAGMEYSELREEVERARGAEGGFERVALGTPILETPALLRGILCELMKEVRPGLEPKEGVLLVAHGSRHEAAAGAYEQAAKLCRSVSDKLLLGTLMPPLELGGIVQECRRTGLTRLRLVPFTIAAGSSATSEMAGSDPRSWQTLLEAEGIACQPVLRGLGDYAGIAGLWAVQADALLRAVCAEPNPGAGPEPGAAKGVDV